MRNINGHAVKTKGGKKLKYNDYNHPDNWIGGYYELSIEFEASGDDNRLNQALMALQNFKSFNGLWRESQHFKSYSISLPIKLNEDSVNQFYGTISMTDGKTLPSLISLIRVEGESDWLDLSIPQSTLQQFYPCQYPLTKKLNPWLAEVDEILIKLAETIFYQSPFEIAMIGEEISGYKNEEEFTLEDVKKVTSILPITLQNRLGIQGQGKELTNNLRLFS